MKEFIRLCGISKSFGGVKALQDIDMTIYEGQTRCLAGENGSGKSTIIKIISGYYPFDSGYLEINGRQYKSITPKQAIREGIQIIYQDFAVFPNLSVAENIAMTSEYNEGKMLVEWKTIRRKAQGIMEKIGVEIDLDARLGDLPVADKQLVAICRALLQEAKLLIMDEPTTALTKKEVTALFRLVRGLQEKGISILFVSHKLEEVFEIADELTILNNGRKVIEGPMKDFDTEKFVYHMTGRKLDKSRFQVECPSDRELLRAEHISAKTLFEDISFTLRAGEIIGITGLLGSGRSELAKALFGMVRLDGGRLVVEGETVVLRGVRDAVAHKIAYVPEDRLTEGLFLSHSISRNTMVSAWRNAADKLGFLSGRSMNRRVDHWIDELKIVTPSGELPAQSLSGGNQQKVVIAKWLETEPHILILNSPTVGVDVGSKSDIHQYARKLARAGMGVVIISDDISEVVQNCSRVLIMKQGRIAEELDTDGLDDAKLSAKLSEN